MNLSAEKNQVRALLLQARDKLDRSRRAFAEQHLLQALTPLLLRFPNVLSFCSFGSEIETSGLNRQLAKQKKLLLPKVSGEELSIYAIDDIEAELLPSYKNLLEPDPIKCRLMALEKIHCVLVPGLGFDRCKYRIGYGKGHYDRLLSKLKQMDSPPLTIGIGFKEQFVEDALPREAHDLSLDQIYLV